MSIHELVIQTEAALSARLYFLALNTALVIPDICAAMSSTNGAASAKKYENWYNKWARPKYTKRLLARAGSDFNFGPQESAINGRICYGYRCGVLHQGRSYHDYITGYWRIIFTEKQSRSDEPFHQNFAENVLLIDIDEFCYEIIEGYEDWYESSKSDPIVIANEKSAFRRYPTGLLPYASGIPCSG